MSLARLYCPLRVHRVHSMGKHVQLASDIPEGEVRPGHDGVASLILRLNRWTGSVVECVDLVEPGASVSLVVCPH
jgi:hypothetical protein